MIRLFSAIRVPNIVAAGLVERQHGVPDARWRPPESLHITLRFFGEMPEPTADDLDQALAAVGGRRFTLRLEGAGHFGEGDRIRAIWAGVAESAPLRALAARCETAARRVGLKPETRNYAPHVTLAYLTRPDPARVAAWLQSHNLLKSDPFEVERFGLYSSWQGKSGSVYRLEREYLLS